MGAIDIACLVVRAFVKVDELLQCGWRIFISKPVNHWNALSIPSSHPRSQLIARRWPIFKGYILTKVVHTSRWSSDRRAVSHISGRVHGCRADADQRAK
jgi:hypothetical protein